MPRRDVTDELRHDVLVDIPKGQERRFGTGGGPFPNPPRKRGREDKAKLCRVGASAGAWRGGTAPTPPARS